MTYVNTEEMRRAAATADSAADSMRRSANTVDEAVRSLVQMFEQGYGGPGLRLIELLQDALPLLDQAPATPMIQVTQEDGNNYCLILSLLGMEEEGDPVAKVQQLVIAAQAPVAEVNLWKARALEAENTVLKWEARATALDHANLDAILSALEDPEHQAEEEAERAFHRNEGLEQAAVKAQETADAIFEKGSAPHAAICTAVDNIRALKVEQ